MRPHRRREDRERRKRKERLDWRENRRVNKPEEKMKRAFNQIPCHCARCLVMISEKFSATCDRSYEKEKGAEEGEEEGEEEGRLTQRNVIIQDIRNMRENDHLECLEVWHD